MALLAMFTVRPSQIMVSVATRLVSATRERNLRARRKTYGAGTSFAMCQKSVDHLASVNHYAGRHDLRLLLTLTL